MDGNVEKQIIAYLRSIDRRLRRIEDLLKSRSNGSSSLSMEEKIAPIKAQGGSVLDLCRPKSNRRKRQ